MANVKTFDLVFFFSGAKGTGREYINISRTAVKYYIEYWKEHEDFLGYDVGPHEPLVSN